MLRRSIAVCCGAMAIGCSSAGQPDTATPTDAGAESTLQPSQKPVTVSSAFDVYVAPGLTTIADIETTPAVHVSATLVGLPPGVTASTTATDNLGTASIVVRAAPDAPQADVTAQIVVYDRSGVRGDAPLRVAVGTSNGAPDPSFGQSGVEQRWSAPVAAIVLTDTGLFAATRSSQGACAVERLNPDGSLDTTWANGGSIVVSTTPSCYATALARDPAGDLAVLVDSVSNFAFVELDANGVVHDSISTSAATAVTWAGDRWALLDGTSLRAIDPASSAFGSLSLLDGAYHDVAASPDGSVIVVGQTTDQVSAATAIRALPTANGFLIDTSFGADGVAHLGPSAMSATTALADGFGGFFVGVDHSVVHLDATGTITASASLPQLSAVHALVTLPSGDLVVLGDHGAELGLARYTSALLPVDGFGAFGSFASPELRTGANSSGVYDGTASRLYVTAWTAMGAFHVTP